MYVHSIDSLKAQIEEAKKNTPAPIDYEERITNIHAVIDSLRDPDIDARSKNDFMKQFIEKIEFDAVDFGKGKGGAPVLDIYFKWHGQFTLPFVVILYALLWYTLQDNNQSSPSIIIISENAEQ